MSTHAIEVNGLKKIYNRLVVLENISFSIESGEIVSIIGSSGSGKSTLLRCLTQLEIINGGEVIIDGDRMAWTEGKVVYASKDILKAIRLKTGLVFQNFNLFPHYNVIRNITEAPIHVLGKPKDIAMQEAYALLERLGLQDKAECYPYQLSGGQSQRVSIARALALQPKILFFDEPTSALDPELTGEVLKVIKSLTTLGITMVIVTHEMAFAREISDRLIFMDEGIIVENDKPEVVFNSDNPRVKSFLRNYSESIS